MAAHGLTGAVLALLLAGCTVIYATGDDAAVSVDKTGTEVDTEIKQKKGPDSAGPTSTDNP